MSPWERVRRELRLPCCFLRRFLILYFQTQSDLGYGWNMKTMIESLWQMFSCFERYLLKIFQNRVVFSFQSTALHVLFFTNLRFQCIWWNLIKVQVRLECWIGSKTVSGVSDQNREYYNPTEGQTFLCKMVNRQFEWFAWLEIEPILVPK